MKEVCEKYCKMLVDNRDRIKDVFPWESGLICLASAGIYTMRDKLADEQILRESKELMKQKVSIFSNFRGTVRVPAVVMLAVSDHPSDTLDKGLAIYKRLKKDFWSSPYLPLAAMMIAQMTETGEYENLAARTKTLYSRMKAEHPFLTSGEDSPFCAMLAFSNKSDDELIQDMENCFHILKLQFFSGNAVQSLTHVLALFEEEPEIKCEKTMQLYQGLKESGRKYGGHYELPALGVLAMTEVPVKEIVQEMLEIDAWLTQQKGFGFWGGITKNQRLMYAGMLAQKDYVKTEPWQTAAIGGTVAMIVAQETALCAAVAASVAASSANSSSN